MTKKELNEPEIKAFQEEIFTWWERHKRNFPWRKTKDPYKIMVSEIMLQQTQTTRVKDIFRVFIKIYPTVESLASANQAEIVKFWSNNRLGYNRRALYLHEAAKKIHELGEFPKTPEELLKLKGIGTYTSRSIPIFAHNMDVATVDTNIRKILIYKGFATEKNTDKELLEIATILVPKGRSRDWHNALMDWGALHAKTLNKVIKPRTKQKKFKGSNRQFRGRIIRYLSKKSLASKDEIINFLKLPEKKCGVILESLVKDKLLLFNEEKQGYSLP